MRGAYIRIPLPPQCRAPATTQLRSLPRGGRIAERSLYSSSGQNSNQLFIWVPTATGRENSEPEGERWAARSRHRLLLILPQPRNPQNPCCPSPDSFISPQLCRPSSALRSAQRADPHFSRSRNPGQFLKLSQTSSLGTSLSQTTPQTMGSSPRKLPQTYLLPGSF